MVTSICLLACALTVGQAPDRSEWLFSPQLTPGLELVYLGSYTEESLIPNVQYQQHYRLETQFLVLEGKQRSWQVAVMTSLSLRDGKQERQPPANGGRSSSVRLEILQVNSQGRVSDASGASVEMSLSGPPTLEFGAFVEAPLTKVSKNGFWPVNEEGRPPRTWTVVGNEVCGGISCIKLVGEQQSEDWDRPRADRAAWRRRDTVWIAPQLGVAQKVERVVERREPGRREPTQRGTVRYELESRLQYPGKLLEDRRQEIVKAAKFQEEARPLLATPAQYSGQIDALAKKVAYYRENQAPTPYRNAILQLEGRLDRARKGETPPEPSSEDIPIKRTAVDLGQKAPDFVVTDLISKKSTRLSRLLGKPVLVFFYNPTTSTGKDVLQFARELAEKHGDNISILAMAVTQDAGQIRKQHSEMRLPFAIHDGKGLHLTFGVEATPRLVLLDADGIVRAAHTGWGFHTPREITQELSRCLPR